MRNGVSLIAIVACGFDAIFHKMCQELTAADEPEGQPGRAGLHIILE